MNTSSDNDKAKLTEIAKAIGAILGLPLALFAVANSILEQPLTSLAVALITAVVVSVWVILSRWVSVTEIITAWLAFAVVVLAGFVIWPRTMTVEGFVYDAARNAVKNEKVRLIDSSGKIYETQTNAEGYYQFIDVPTGQYKLQVRTSELEGETKGILVRVVQQNLTVPEISATASPTSFAAVTPNTPTVTQILPTKTPKPPTATFTLEPIQAAQGWPLVVKEPFDTNERGWRVGDFSEEWMKGNRRIIDGKYRWEVEAIQSDSWEWAIAPLDPVYDFYLTVEAKVVSEPQVGSCGYGVVFRREGGNYCYIKVLDSQYFRVWLSHRGEWTELIGWLTTSAIRPGEVNRLTVIAEGSHLRFYINDRYVADASDDQLKRGNVALVVSVYNAGDKAIVEFDDFELRRKP